jgi:hypothetical protein
MCALAGDANVRGTGIAVIVAAGPVVARRMGAGPGRAQIDRARIAVVRADDPIRLLRMYAKAQRANVGGAFVAVLFAGDTLVAGGLLAEPFAAHWLGARIVVIGTGLRNAEAHTRLAVVIGCAQVVVEAVDPGQRRVGASPGLAFVTRALVLVRGAGCSLVRRHERTHPAFALVLCALLPVVAEIRAVHETVAIVVAPVAGFLGGGGGIAFTESRLAADPPSQAGPPVVFHRTSGLHFLGGRV